MRAKGSKNTLLYDFSQTAIPTDAVDADWLTKPRKWTIGSIQRFILFIGPISSIFDDCSKPGFTADSAIDDGHSLNAEKYWHENCINTGGFFQAHRTFKKKMGAAQREAKEKKEDKMIWTEGNHP